MMTFLDRLLHSKVILLWVNAAFASAACAVHRGISRELYA